MSKFSDQEYLRSEQYQDASNLNARIQLHARFSTNKKGWHPWVFEQLNLPSECRILELGCGPADLWRENLHRTPEGWDLTLSDFSMGMVQQARHNLSASSRRFAFDVVDAQAIPYGDGVFDGIIANHMLFHVPDIEKALSEIQRVLKPGGRFYATTVGETHMRELRELVNRFAPERGHSDQGFLRSFVLENGLDHLSPWFSHATLRRYEDGLVITEAGPLIAYVRSMIGGPPLSGDRLAEFTEYVDEQLASHGAIHVTKDSGLFEAVRGDSG